ncbi:MAG TPA: glycosyltransferase [Thermoanaerobaculia bacterium]|nr:glycosyltransferase [Thermoanaerobaculia bacterium]
MRFLLATYCFARTNGEAQIGVYKRSLRLALEMIGRGHEVVVFCPGHEDYGDALTRLLDSRVRYVEIPFTRPDLLGARQNRRVFRRALRQIRPDVVVVGEAPLAGTLLETTLAAIELGIPVAMLDNVYNPCVTGLAWRSFGGMMDAVILNGPNSFHLPEKETPRRMLQVSPYVEVWREEASRLLAELGLCGERLVVVLGYDSEVLSFGLSLMEALSAQGFEALVVVSRWTGEEERLAKSRQAPGRVRIIHPPADPVLFGLVERARLAVVKYGYMQVTECMTLRTPAVVVYRGSVPWLRQLPPGFEPFLHVVQPGAASREAVGGAHRLLALDRSTMPAAGHAGCAGAAAMAVRFLEKLERASSEIGEACSQLGFTLERASAALACRHPGRKVEAGQLRALRLRTLPCCDLYSLACNYRLNGSERSARLWGRLYETPGRARADFRRASTPSSGRHVLFFDPDTRVLFEEDLGEAALPPAGQPFPS